MAKEVSVVICAYNEEKSIKDAVLGVREALEGHIDNYEIIIVNDGSQDQTRTIVDQLAKEYPQVKVCHHPVNQGFGAALKSGFGMAQKEYISNFPGDNDVSALTIRNLVKEMGSADIILSYHSGPQNRPAIRTWMSRLAVWFFNAFFGLKAKYYNGSFLYRAKDVKNLSLMSSGLAILPECSISLLTSGLSYREVPMPSKGRVAGKSSTIRLKYYKENIRWMFALKKRLILRKPKDPSR